MQFQSAYGTFTEVGNDLEDDEDDSPPTDCQSVFAPGICRASVPEKYYVLKEYVTNLLRHSRSIRRTSGFVPDHPILLWCSTDSLQASIESKQIQVFLLCRLTFSPFGGTAIEFNMTGERIASLAIASGEAKFYPLPKLLYMFSLEEGNYFLKTTKYTAISLHEIELDLGSVQDFSSGLVQQSLSHDHGDGGKDDDDMNSGDSDEDNKFKKMSALLKLAVGEKRRKQKTSVSRKSSNKAAGSISVKKDSCKLKPKPRQKQEQDPELKEHPEFPGAAGDHHDEIVTAWSTALESNLGPVPSEADRNKSKSESLQAQSGPSSSSRANSQQTENTIPIISKTLPWRDDAGHCWVYNESTQLPLHLGQAPIQSKLQLFPHYDS